MESIKFSTIGFGLIFRLPVGIVTEFWPSLYIAGKKSLLSAYFMLTYLTEKETKLPETISFKRKKHLPLSKSRQIIKKTNRKKK